MIDILLGLGLFKQVVDSFIAMHVC